MNSYWATKADVYILILIFFTALFLTDHLMIYFIKFYVANVWWKQVKLPAGLIVGLRL